MPLSKDLKPTEDNNNNNISAESNESVFSFDCSSIENLRNSVTEFKGKKNVTHVKFSKLYLDMDTKLRIEILNLLKTEGFIGIELETCAKNIFEILRSDLGKKKNKVSPTLETINLGEVKLRDKDAIITHAAYLVTNNQNIHEFQFPENEKHYSYKSYILLINNLCENKIGLINKKIQKLDKINISTQSSAKEIEDLINAALDIPNFDYLKSKIEKIKNADNLSFHIESYKAYQKLLLTLSNVEEAEKKKKDFWVKINTSIAKCCSATGDINNLLGLLQQNIPHKQHMLSEFFYQQGHFLYNDNLNNTSDSNLFLKAAANFILAVNLENMHTKNQDFINEIITRFIGALLSKIDPKLAGLPPKERPNLIEIFLNGPNPNSKEKPEFYKQLNEILTGLLQELETLQKTCADILPKTFSNVADEPKTDLDICMWFLDLRKHNELHILVKRHLGNSTDELSQLKQENQDLKKENLALQQLLREKNQKIEELQRQLEEAQSHKKIKTESNINGTNPTLPSFQWLSISPTTTPSGPPSNTQSTNNSIDNNRENPGNKRKPEQDGNIKHDHSYQK